MALIGYHASHEQFTPSALLKWASLAEKVGFEMINSSDHFHPWSKRQGQSGFSFAWLGAAMQTTKVPFGLVCAPGQRYHPAIVAQAISTLCEMFPGRLTVSLGSGEALNERITSEKWPAKPQRNARLLECAEIITRLLNGEQVTHHGLVHVEEAKLYTLPPVKPQLLGAAVTPETAEWLGSWADGMITISSPMPQLKRMVDSFRKGGGLNKPIYLKVQLSYARTKDAAIEGAFDQWRTNIFSGSVLADLWKVEQFDALGEMVQREELFKMIDISHDLDEHAAKIKEYMQLGFAGVILHNVNREQEQFIHDFAKGVLPKLKAQ